MQERISNYKIIYAIPKYIEGKGDLSLVLDSSGKEIIMNFHIRSFIRKLAFENYIDLVSIKRRLQKQFGQKNLLPYPINSELILIPVKVRIPKLKKDGAFGYINYLWVKEIERQEGYSQVFFKNNTSLKVLQGYQSIKTKMIQGAWIQDCFLPQAQYKFNRSQEFQCREELQQIIGQLIGVYREL